MMDMFAIKLYIGLFTLILINITLGSLNAIFEKSFDIKLMFKGLIKGIIVVLCMGGTCFVGYLNSDIVAMQINGTEFDVLTALHVVVLTSYYFYAKQVIEKLTSLLNGAACNIETGEDNPPAQNIDTISAPKHCKANDMKA